MWHLFLYVLHKKITNINLKKIVSLRRLINFHIPLGLRTTTSARTPWIKIIYYWYRVSENLLLNQKLHLFMVHFSVKESLLILKNPFHFNKKKPVNTNFLKIYQSNLFLIFSFKACVTIKIIFLILNIIQNIAGLKNIPFAQPSL